MQKKGNKMATQIEKTGGSRTLTKAEAQAFEKAEAEKMEKIHADRKKLVAKRNKKLTEPAAETQAKKQADKTQEGSKNAS